MMSKERFKEIDGLVDTWNEQTYAKEEYPYDNTPLWTLLACYTSKDTVPQPWSTTFKKKVATMKRKLEHAAQKMKTTLEELLDWYRNYHLPLGEKEGDETIGIHPDHRE